MPAKIGLGILTYNRPEFFKTAYDSVQQHIRGKLDVFVAYHDGPAGEGYDGYPELTAGETNKGSAHGKNWLLKKLIDEGCTHLFIMEDDVEIVSEQAIAAYIAAARVTKIPHLNFSQHGPNTKVTHVATNGICDFWPNAVGAFSYYTKELIDEYGYMDENFRNAYDHVEHTWRIYKGKFTYGVYPDVTGSTRFIREQPGALENSTNRDDNWLARVNEARAYWQSKDKDCPLRGGTI
jgi:hypothetical protein